MVSFGKTFSPGDVIQLKRGTVFRDANPLFLVAARHQGVTVTNYGAGELPIINAANIQTGWAGTGPTYTVALTISPNQVFVNGSRIPKASSLAAIQDGEWWWASNTLTYRTPSGNPDSQGLVVEASVRDQGISINGADVTIDGVWVTKANSQGIFIQNSDGTLQNSKIDWCYLSGVSYFDAVNLGAWTVQDNIVEHIGGNGIGMAEGASNWIVQRNSVSAFSELSGNASHDFSAGIKMNGATCSGCLIAENTVFDPAVNTSATDCGAGIWADTGSDDHIWRDNVIMGCNFDGMRVEISSGTTIHHNLVVGRAVNPKVGIAIDRGVQNNLVYHNTVYGCDYGLICQEAGTSPCSGNVFKNNIVVGSVTKALRAAEGGANPAGEGNVYQNNILKEGANYITWGASTYSTNAAWQAGATGVSGNLGSDPLLVDPANDDYTLQPTSPAKNAGVVIAGINDGTGGSTAYSGSAPDIGAFELLASAISGSGSPTKTLAPFADGDALAAAAGCTPELPLHRNHLQARRRARCKRHRCCAD